MFFGMHRLVIIKYLAAVTFNANTANKYPANTLKITLQEQIREAFNDGPHLSHLCFESCVTTVKRLAIILKKAH